MKKRIMAMTTATLLGLSMMAGAVIVNAAPMDPGNRQISRHCYSGNMDGRMIISEPGQYTLTGQMSGMIYVDPGAGDVKLIMDGVNINGMNGPALVAMSGDSISIELAKGSRNALSGGSNSDYATTIYSRIPMTFEGAGVLDMRSSGQNGVYVTNEPLTINGGTFNISAGTNAFSATNTAFNGGNVYFDAGMNAFNPGARVSMNGGRVKEVANIQNMAGAGDIRSSFENQNMQNNQLIGQSENNGSTVSSPTDIVTGITENSAMSLTADYDNATTIVITDDDSSVKIDESGTYVVTGSSSDGSITVKKGTTGVVLVLEDLDLTSTSGAALSINKDAEVQVVISGTVTLTDSENPDDEYSEDADVADAYDGAAIKIKAGSTVYITGDGTLNVNGDAKNGIKAGDDSSLIIDGDLVLNIDAVNDGINSNYDVTILNGMVNISAGDDGIHADHILTIGEDGSGPDLTISKSTEGLEGTVVNIGGGNIDVTATDDAINAANSDGTYESELDYSVNVTGGEINITAGTDGIDSNGNINLIAGSAKIKSANNGGDAGIDYDGEYYVSDSFKLNNQSGVAGPDNMMGGMPGQMDQNGVKQVNQPGCVEQQGGQPGGMDNRFGPGR